MSDEGYKEGGFRLKCSKLFMTYSQCDGTKEDLLAFLDSKVSIDDYVIAKELHQDGGSHLHVYIKVNKIVDTRNPRFFDWGKFHPKFEKAKSESKVIRYCKKDGDYITNMNFNTFQRARDLAKSGEILEALNVIIDEQPKEIVNLDRWERNLKLVARLTTKTTKTLSVKKGFEFNELKGMEKWNRNTRVLILWGRSGWGKTQFAKSLFKNPLLVRHKDKLKQFDEFKHDGIIFDDMSFAHWPRTACIHLLDLDEDADIDVKCSMVTIPAGVPRVITSNNEPRDLFSAFDMSIQRRQYSINIRKDLRKVRGCNVILEPKVLSPAYILSDDEDF